ncbi:type I restriction-modification system endonuclease [Vibrio genomosp. F10 str. 9ZC157]|uniref:Type I restriction-modification system endonuclease n=1 Tax=Vibrio genomosp. F10 str. ZF-129 TaxID=1187848 RepID=A0A1E5BCV5_9VIBR|nr:type I restriction-modification system endonuclease [Vibrio genomosp. F10]OEE32333.1 type I restriction-modification system endonuclease [Vibrio genomosp. F10 str. ZF-129]OEE98127.1 type I restriction-modification system endonuclease [Vibrio genomosp. F10 str. 9ZC157]
MQKSNFEFLRTTSPNMFNALLSAEQNLHNDPNITLVKLRMFGEMCAQSLATRMNLSIPKQQIDLIDALKFTNKINAELISAFHRIRVLGNKAAHDNHDDANDAKLAIRLAHHIAFWYYKLDSGQFDLEKPNFIELPQIDNQLANKELEALRDELTALRKKSATTDEALKIKENKVVDFKGYIAVLESRQTESEQQAKVRIAALEAELAKQREQFEGLNKEQQTAKVHEFTEQAKKNKFELTEAETRFIIDGQLRQAGWEADSEKLKYSKGARPEAGKNRAISEWVIDSAQHKADYVLFIGLQPVAIVEAKKKALSVQDALPQAKYYAENFNYQEHAEENELVFVGGASATAKPAVKKRPTLSLNKVAEETKATYQAANSELREQDKLKPIPYIYSANGREYLQQIKSQSGIWCANADGTKQHVLSAFHSPQDIQAKLCKNRKKSLEWLETHDKKELDLFKPSELAVDAIEDAIEAGQENLLVAMATGTGKTRVAGATMYRLLTSGLCRNALFLVDRRSLGTQAVNSFKEYRIRQMPLADHYNLYELGEKTDQAGDKPWIQIATVQSLSLMLQSENNPLTPGMYDCIIVDEAHRGYNEDAEQTEGEMLFRDQAEYQSKYRQVIDYFDALKIGLTATPATNTMKIFGKPIYEYRFNQAVLDGRLVDQEPPIIIDTELTQQGVQFDKGTTVEQLVDGEIIEGVLPEELNIDISGFNRKVLVPEFNRAVCNALPEYIDPTQAAKTLVFCVNDIHADEVVNMLRDTYRDKLGDEVDDAIIKITGKSASGDSKQIESLITRYRKERLPNIVVTVDLLTTGIDVRPISNLVFLRQVKSRILYEQMKGRATRTCDEINKQTFRIFDAVNLTETIERLGADNLMKPVVTKPNLSLEQLVEEMANPDANDHTQDDGNSFAQQSLDAFTVKLSRTLKKADKLKLEKEGVAAELNQLDALVTDNFPELESAKQLPKHLYQLGPKAAAEAIKSNPWILNREPAMRQAINFGERAPLIYSGDVGEVTVTQNWGGYEKPEEYLAAFERFVQENQNKVTALDTVVNRPRDLTKADLVSLLSKMETKQFNEQTLLQARKAAKQEDVAARIIGLIRQAAIGSPLIPFEERLTHAQQVISERYKLTKPQQKWLKRIVNQMREDLVLNDDSFKVGTLRTKGGKSRADKDLDGQLEVIMKDLIDATWGESA